MTIHNYNHISQMKKYNEANIPEMAWSIPKGALSSELQEVVDKSLALESKIVKDKLALDGLLNPEHSYRVADAVERAAHDLKFSESTINSVRKSILDNTFQQGFAGFNASQSTQKGYNFADATNQVVIGPNTIGIMPMLIQEVGTPVSQRFLLSDTFRDISRPEYTVLVDRLEAYNGLLPEAGGSNSTIPASRMLDMWTQEYQSALFAQRISIPAQIQARQRTFGAGVGGIDRRGYTQLIAYNMNNLAVRAQTTKYKLIADSVFENGFSYMGQNISSNIPTANYLTMQSMGTLNVATGEVTYDTMDPTYNPMIAVLNKVINNPEFGVLRNNVKGIVLNNLDLNAMLNHPTVKAFTNLQQTARETPVDLIINGTAQKIMGYYAPGYNIPLFGDASAWVKSTEGENGRVSAKNNEYFVPRGSMYVLFEYEENNINGAFHLTINEFDPNLGNPSVETPTMGLFLGMFQRNLMNSDTTNRLDLIASLAGAPAVYRPETQYIIKGLYSNVS